MNTGKEPEVAKGVTQRWFQLEVLQPNDEITNVSVPMFSFVGHAFFINLIVDFPIGDPSSQFPTRWNFHRRNPPPVVCEIEDDCIAKKKKWT